MNVELTIQEMFDSYPTLFKERADCLDHLFLVIGNGYEWVNGELVEDCWECNLTPEEIESLSLRLVNGKAYQHNKLSLRAESQLYESRRISEGWYEEMTRMCPGFDVGKAKELQQLYIDKLPDDVYYKEPIRKKRWYCFVNIPGHERIDFNTKYAFLFNYPDDIKPDWKAAIEETKNMLIEDGFELPKIT